MDYLIVVDDSKKGPEPLLGPRPRTNPVLYAGRPAHYAPTRAGAILVENLFGAEQGPPPLQALPDVHAITSVSNGRSQTTTYYMRNADSGISRLCVLCECVLHSGWGHC